MATTTDKGAQLENIARAVENGLITPDEGRLARAVIEGDYRPEVIAEAVLRYHGIEPDSTATRANIAELIAQGVMIAQGVRIAQAQHYRAEA